MKYLVTSEEMKRYDNNTIEKIGIPGMVLMERAALALLKQVEEYLESSAKIALPKEKAKILIMSGTGNNGGDGLALARLLTEKGYPVSVWCVGKQERASAQWKQQMEILCNYPVAIGTEFPEGEYIILVDALFGVGLSRDVEGDYADAIAAFNKRSGYKIAVDVPSGVDADTGKILGCAVKADVTITFGFCKRGIVTYPGCEYAGKVITTDIGISHLSFMGQKPQMFYYDEAVRERMPKRVPGGNKGTFGKVLVIAGSENMAGAAILAAGAAYHAGAGMVKVITPAANRIIVQETIPEALLGTPEDLEESLGWADVVLVGPGIGKGEESHRCLQMVIEQSDLPLVIDADGLNLLAEDTKLQQMLREGKREVVLTPHVGELARLSGREIAVLKENLPKYALETARELQAIVVAKDARTFVCRENRPIYINIRGNSGMATAGSGDVLAGILAAFVAQGMNAFEAACSGVYVHACAGDLAATEVGEHAVMAGDIVKKIGALC